MKLIRKIDTVAAIVLLAGTAYAVITGLMSGEDNSNDNNRRPSVPEGGYYLLGAAGLYALVRTLGPKTKREQRLGQVAQWYDQADGYYRRAKVYRKVAEKMLQRMNKQRKGQ